MFPFVFPVNLLRPLLKLFIPISPTHKHKTAEDTSPTASTLLSPSEQQNEDPGQKHKTAITDLKRVASGKTIAGSRSKVHDVKDTTEDEKDQSSSGSGGELSHDEVDENSETGDEQGG